MPSTLGQRLTLHFLLVKSLSVSLRWEGLISCFLSMYTILLPVPQPSGFRGTFQIFKALMDISTLDLKLLEVTCCLPQLLPTAWSSHSIKKNDLEMFLPTPSGKRLLTGQAPSLIDRNSLATEASGSYQTGHMMAVLWEWGFQEAPTPACPSCCLPGCCLPLWLWLLIFKAIM